MQVFDTGRASRTSSRQALTHRTTTQVRGVIATPMCRAVPSDSLESGDTGSPRPPYQWVLMIPSHVSRARYDTPSTKNSSSVWAKCQSSRTPIDEMPNRTLGNCCRPIIGSSPSDTGHRVFEVREARKSLLLQRIRQSAGTRAFARPCNGYGNFVILRSRSSGMSAAARPAE